MVHVRMDPLSVLIPAAHVARIAERVEAGGEHGAPKDLARLLEVAPPAARRALEVHAGGERGWVVIGEHVAVREIAAGDFVPWPAWLGALAERLPLSGLVRLDHGFAFVLDAARLVGSTAS